MDNVNSPNEVWKIVEEFPDYEISNLGRVKNIKTGFIKKPSISKRGYSVYSMRKDGKMYLRTVHIMLARTFLPNPNKLPQVNHIDGNKTNYNLNNLEWCSARDNMLHARKTGLHKSDGDKMVYQYDKNWNYIRSFKSVAEAARFYGYNSANIASVCRGNTRLRTVGGCYWRYERIDL